jgi:beta-glucosidase
MRSLLLLFLASPLLAAPGDGDWATAYAKAAIALAKLSNSDKVALATGIGWNKGPCVGNTAAIAGIGYPELCLQDGPLGYVNCYGWALRGELVSRKELMREQGEICE